MNREEFQNKIKNLSEKELIDMFPKIETKVSATYIFQRVKKFHIGEDTIEFNTFDMPPLDYHDLFLWLYDNNLLPEQKDNG